MKLSVSRFVALLGALFVASYLVAFFVQRQRVAEQVVEVTPPIEAPAEVEEPARVSEAEFAKSADRVTMGSGVQPATPVPALVEYHEMMRRTAELPDGDEKLQLAQSVGAIRDRAAAPVLLDWAVATTDRALLRSALDALGPLADAELIAEIRRRFEAAFRSDDRYRLAKVIRSITNPEAADVLIELAQDETAPEALIVAATDALATLATPPAVSLLLGKVEAAPPDETGRLMTVIARIDRAEALPALQYAAQGNKDASSDRARVAAIQALGNFRDDQTRALLQALDTDPSDDVRAAARDVLARSR